MTKETANLFAGIPANLPDEHMLDLFEAPGVRIERIVSKGHTSPPDDWYDQDQGEWVMVVEGAARLRFEDEAEDRAMQAGDYVYIAPHVRHRVTWTDPDKRTVWLAIFVEA